jgi:hypothetical protein
MSSCSSVWYVDDDSLASLIDGRSGAAVHFHGMGDLIHASYDSTLPLFQMILDYYREWRAVGRPRPQQYTYQADANGQRVYISDPLLHFPEVVWSCPQTEPAG